MSEDQQISQEDLKAMGFVSYELPIFVENDTGRRFIIYEGKKVYEDENTTHFQILPSAK
jgi:hypothetical protein